MSVHTKSLLLIVDIRGMYEKKKKKSSFGVSEKKESEMEGKKFIQQALIKSSSKPLVESFSASTISMPMSIVRNI